MEAIQSIYISIFKYYDKLVLVVKINYLKGVALKEKSKIITILVTIFNNLENYVTASNIVL